MSGPSTNSIFDARVLELIRKAILAGEPMPLNGAMARRLKCGDSTVTTAMTRLTRSGAVWVQRIGNARVAGILGVGQTADVDPAELNQRVPLSPDDIETRRVNRSTCFRCGVRSDHGCSHLGMAA